MTTTAILTASAPITAVETFVTGPLLVAVPAPSNAFKVTLIGTLTSDITCNPTFNFRMGPAGSMLDTVVASVSPTTVSSGKVPQPFSVEFIGTVQTVAPAPAGFVETFANVQGNENSSVVGITQVGQFPAVLNTNLAISGIAALGSITGGSAYTNGTYVNVPLTVSSGTVGTGARGTVVVAGGAVTAVTITTAGSGYDATSVLSVAAANVGGTGSGFTVPVTYLNSSGVGTFGTLVGGTGYVNGTYTNVPLTGFGTGVTGTFVVAGGTVTSVTVTNPGYNLAIGNTLVASNTFLGGTGSGFSVLVGTNVTGLYIGASVIGSIQIVDYATMTVGSANIALTGVSPLAVDNIGNIGIGKPVSFAATVGTVSGQVLTGTVYYIVASNVGTGGLTNTIQVSATPGGVPVVFNAAGTTNMALANNCVIVITQAIVQQM